MPNFKLSPNGGKMRSRSRGIFNPRWYRAIMCFLMVLAHHSAYASAMDVESDTDVITQKVRIISESLFSLFPSILKSLLLLLPNPKIISSLRYGRQKDVSSIGVRGTVYKADQGYENGVSPSKLTA